MDKLKEKLISLTIFALDNSALDLADRYIDMLVKLNESMEQEVKNDERTK